MSAVHHDRLFFVPLDELQKPKNGYEVVVGAYWVVHPEKGAVFFKRGKNIRDAAPQYNRDKNVANIIMPKLYPDCECVYVETAYIPMGNYE